MDPLALNVFQRFTRRVATQWAYHGTNSAVLPHIIKRGLMTGAYSSYGDSYSEFDDGKHLFFVNSEEAVRGYGDTVLRFPWPTDAKPDVNKYGRILAHQFVSKFSVTPEKIEIERDGKWEPLVPKFKVTYTGVFLDEASHHELLEWWSKATNIPFLGKTWAHHMTLKFNPTAEELEATPVGEKVKLKVVGWAADEKGQAVLVEPEGITSANKHPHVTISTAPGTGPVYSNDLLAKGHNRVSGPTLTGVVDAR